MPYINSELAADLVGLDPPITEKELYEMLLAGEIGMDGFQYCSLEDARDCRERMEMEKRRKLRKADAS